MFPLCLCAFVVCFQENHKDTKAQRLEKKAIQIELTENAIIGNEEWLHKGVRLLIGRLILAIAILNLHVPACHWIAASANAEEVSTCKCCAHKSTPSRPAPSKDNSPKQLPPVDCPCLACSPGFVPLGESPLAHTIELVVAEFVMFDQVIAPDDVLRSRLDRPPRFSV